MIPNNNRSLILIKRDPVSNSDNLCQENISPMPCIKKGLNQAKNEYKLKFLVLIPIYISLI